MALERLLALRGGWQLSKSKKEIKRILLYMISLGYFTGQGRDGRLSDNIIWEPKKHVYYCYAYMFCKTFGDKVPEMMWGI